MEEPNLLVICLNAFVAVIGLLTILSGALRGLIEIFPERGGAEARQPESTLPQSGADTAIAVAIATAANSIVPGARVTRIEEIH